jgi:LPS export ABC transporter protein LptC
MSARPFLLVALTVALAACRTKGTAPPVEGRATLADSAEQMLVTTRSLLVDRGVQRGEMFADTVYVFDDNTRFDMRKVRVTFNTATGAKDGTMTANRGIYNVRNGTLEGFGNVVLVSNDGKRLTSPQLKYMQAVNEVSSDTSFTLVRPGQTVSGIGFKSDPQLTRFNIKKGARGSGSFTLPGT